MRRLLIVMAATMALAGCVKPFGFPTGEEAEEEASQPIPMVMMSRLQEDLDLKPVHAAAILGNLAQETGNFTHLQQVKGPSFGYSQWLGSRKEEFLAFAEKNGGKHSFEANYKFILHEINEYYPDMIERIRDIENLDLAARIFMREFLRPSQAHANLPARIEYANLYLKGDFSGSGCLGPEYLEGDRIRTCPEDLVELPPRKQDGQNPFVSGRRWIAGLLKKAPEHPGSVRENVELAGNS